MREEGVVELLSNVCAVLGLIGVSVSLGALAGVWVGVLVFSVGLIAVAVLAARLAAAPAAVKPKAKLRRVA